MPAQPIIRQTLSSQEGGCVGQELLTCGCSLLLPLMQNTILELTGLPLRLHWRWITYHVELDELVNLQILSWRTTAHSGCLFCSYRLVVEGGLEKRETSAW